MSPISQSAYDVELLADDGLTWLGFMLDRPKGTTSTNGITVSASAWKPGDEVTLSSVLSASAQDQPISEDFTTAVAEDWSGGLGAEQNGYNAAYCVYTRTPGYALPAGAATPVSIQGAGHTHYTNSPIVAFAEFKGDLYVAQQGTDTSFGGRILKLAGGMGPAAEVAAMILPSTERIRDLLVADDGSGNTTLYCTSESTTHTNGRLHATVDGTTWTHTTAGMTFAATRGLGRMATVYWTTSGEVDGAWRLVALTGDKTFAYTFPNFDPMGGTANWCPDIRVGTTGRLVDIAPFRRHVYFAASDDLYDVNELGESQAMTEYLRKMLQPGAGSAVQAFNGYVYVAVGRGIVRVYVGDGSFQESPLEGQCAPGWGTSAEHEGRGYVTAMCVDQGYLVAAVYNPTLKKSYIYWGVDRRIVNAQTRNPLAWYGPEVVYNFSYQVTRMQTSGLASDGSLRLWLGADSGAGSILLHWVSLPVAGSPLDDLIAGGPHRFVSGQTGDVIQPYARLESLQDSGGDKGKLQILYQHTIGSRGPLGPTVTDAHIRFDTRADPPPGAAEITWTTNGTVLESPVQNITPDPVVSGHKTQWRAQLFSPGADNPLATPTVAVLDAVRTLRWDVAPSLSVATLTVRYGDGVTNHQNALDEERSPDWKSDQLQRLTEYGRTVMRDRQGQRWDVKVRQARALVESLHDRGPGRAWGKTVTAQVQVSVLGASPAAAFHV